MLQNCVTFLHFIEFNAFFPGLDILCMNISRAGMQRRHQFWWIRDSRLMYCWSTVPPPGGRRTSTSSRTNTSIKILRYIDLSTCFMTLVYMYVGYYLPQLMLMMSVESPYVINQCIIEWLVLSLRAYFRVCFNARFCTSRRVCCIMHSISIENCHGLRLSMHAQYIFLSILWHGCIYSSLW